MEAVRSFAAAHPDWHLRVDDPPAGYRLLSMHDVFDPQDDAAKQAFAAVSTDPRFARRCALLPKPWRIGYKPKEPLPKSKWPFPTEHLARRQRWLAGYDSLAPPVRLVPLCRKPRQRRGASARRGGAGTA